MPQRFPVPSVPSAPFLRNFTTAAFGHRPGWAQGVHPLRYTTNLPKRYRRYRRYRECPWHKAFRQPYLAYTSGTSVIATLGNRGRRVPRVRPSPIAKKSAPFFGCESTIVAPQTLGFSGHFWPQQIGRLRAYSALMACFLTFWPTTNYRVRTMSASITNETSSPDRTANDPVPSRQRSRVTNGSALLLGVDGRSAWIRRCRDVIAAHLSDMGGEDNTSAAERSIIRRASVMTVELERLESKFAQAGEASACDLDLYVRAAGNLRRLLESVGIERRAKNVPTLSDYLKAGDAKANAA